jgi:chromosome segregation ATPase
VTATERIRVDVSIANRAELVDEVLRLGEVVDRWSSNWHDICEANREAWEGRVRSLEDERNQLCDTIRSYEGAIEGLSTTIGEQRQQLSAIRDYAQELHVLADTTRDAGGDYLAHTYDEIATALERKIGDKP